MTERDIQAFADGVLSSARAARMDRHLGLRQIEAQRLKRQAHPAFKQVADYRSPASLERRRMLRSGLRNMLIVVCAALAVVGWCAATHVSEHMLDASAVMALLDASSRHSSNVPPLVSHDPYFMELTPVGLELLATKTKRASLFADIDELDYRNADGDSVILLAASAPFASEQPHWRAQRVGDIRLLSWAKDGKRYVLAGRAATHGLMRAADALTTTSQRTE
ncbi:hypothetical protein AWB71_00323 [Caballeronia peredens]|nr:hypothetical protein AWB71_00323 [Caballeronia peredens]